MEQSSYRARIYRYYTSSRQQFLVPESIEGLSVRAPTLRKIISRHFPENYDAAILDLGCGHGAFVHFMHEAGYHRAVGVDVSAAQVAEAKRLGIEGVKQGDLLEELQSMDNGSQDMVIAFDVIEHFTKEELLTFVDHVHRVLRSGGVWIIHTPNGESPFVGRILYSDFTHEQAFTQTSMSQLLQSSGFARVECFEDVPVVHGVKSALRWFIWKVFRRGLRLYLAAETGDTAKDAIFTQNFLTIVTK